MKKTGVLVLTLVASSLGCGGESLDVGGDGSGGGSGGTADVPIDPPPNGPPLPDWPSLRTCPPGNPESPFAGSWDGADENFDFEPRIRLRLEIESASEDAVCGHLVWGEDDSAPPPAVDPETDYPPAVDTEFGVRDGAPVLIEGVRYTIIGGVTRDDTLRFHTIQSEPYEGYCTLQAPLFDLTRMQWQCLPEGTDGVHVNNRTQECIISTKSGPLTTSITQCAACLDPLCACNETGCTAAVTTQLELEFDLSLGESDGAPILTGAASSDLHSADALRLLRVE